MRIANKQFCIEEPHFGFCSYRSTSLMNTLRKSRLLACFNEYLNGEIKWEQEQIFIKKENDTLVWLASIAWDGYPDAIDAAVINAETDSNYVEALTEFLKGRDDVSLPKNGWPWPWDNSNTTDYSYVFDGDHVKACSFGGNLFDARKYADCEDTEEIETNESFKFPDMSDKQNVQLSGSKSGLIVLGC